MGQDQEFCGQADFPIYTHGLATAFGYMVVRPASTGDYRPWLAHFGFQNPLAPTDDKG